MIKTLIVIDGDFTYVVTLNNFYSTSFYFLFELAKPHTENYDIKIFDYGDLKWRANDFKGIDDNLRSEYEECVIFLEQEMSKFSDLEALAKRDKAFEKLWNVASKWGEDKIK